MNDRLEIASRLLSGIMANTDLVSYKKGEFEFEKNVDIQFFIDYSLSLSDILIKTSKDTITNEEIQIPPTPYQTAACHVKKGQFIELKDGFVEVVNIDKNDIYTFIFLADSFLTEKYKHNEEVTVKDKIDG